MSLYSGMLELLNPEFAERMRKQRKEQNKRRLETAEFVDWHPKIKWQPELNIRAESYKPIRLFNVKPMELVSPNKAEPDMYADSPTSEWRYMNNILPTGTPLQTWNGSKIGNVMFDGPVVIPVIYQRCRLNKEKGNLWFNRDDGPWMSLTIAEVMSMRGGTRRAKGDVIVAGLGLGHQLIEVSKREKVRSLTLVERNQELVDWLLPAIEPHLGRKLDDVVVGNAYEELPKMKADVALVDIFKHYGNNLDDVNYLRDKCKEIDYIWGWGTATIH